MTLKAVNFFTNIGPITFSRTIFYGVGWLVISMGIRVEPRKGHAGQEGEYRYSSTLSLT